MPSYGASLLSGGLDSTTVTALAKGKTDHLTALTFHYGQTTAKKWTAPLRSPAPWACLRS